MDLGRGGEAMQTQTTEKSRCRKQDRQIEWYCWWIGLAILRPTDAEDKRGPHDGSSQGVVASLEMWRKLL